MRTPACGGHTWDQAAGVWLPWDSFATGVRSTRLTGSGSDLLVGGKGLVPITPAGEQLIGSDKQAANLGGSIVNLFDLDRDGFEGN